MININELRPAVEAAGLNAISVQEVLELLDRLESAESCALEQARLNGMGSEREAALMAKLEAAEKERDELRIELNDIRYGVAVAHDTIKALRAKIEAMEKGVTHIKEVEFPRKARAVAVGWETKCVRLEQERTIDEQRIADLMAELNRVGHENEELRARIEAMEKQEPVAWCAIDETGTVIEALGMNQSRRFDTALYRASGAKGEEK